ncbi:protein trichome birefringence-like 26 [Arachis hypogaea]|uniref:protein trichome birefringence-like 26 n=1 Tax=Arachis hypogaea TaxID=3818 RepID=UPI000DED0D06|nr:protein trichome birefringence-like 26 isoform X2 [Arachis hypogaea]
MLKVKFLCAEECDYFSGDWVPNPFGPFYTNETCSHIESHQNCLKNGRPDRKFLYWRWAPRGYELPLFDARKFLNMMHGKVWALIGDSISRNHVQSLICILSTLMFLGRGSNIVNPASWKRIKHIRLMKGFCH